MLRAIFQPAPPDYITGLSRKLGEFWIMEKLDENTFAEVVVHVTVPADPDRYVDINRYGNHGFFAHLRVHYDAINILRQLDQRGFLSRFESIGACTLYDVLQCLQVAGIPLECRDGDDQMMSRKMYELLVENRPLEEVA